jgi:hypothetical protein
MEIVARPTRERMRAGKERRARRQRFCNLSGAPASNQDARHPEMNVRRRNWFPLLGFLLSLAAFASYLFFFARFPVTRDLPWATALLFLAALALGVVGLRRAYAAQPAYGGRSTGPLLTVLILLVAGGFTFFVTHASRQLPASTGAPRVGQKAPEFTLPDIHGQRVSLAGLLAQPLSGQGGPATPPRAVLLVFYRGYW